MTKISLTEAEEGIALDYISGVDLLDSYRNRYPDSKVNDGHARYKAKEILKRERVAAYIEQTKSRGDLTDQINEISIKKYLWETAQKNQGKQVGLQAALALGKEFGIGTQTLLIKEERAFDTMLIELHKYNDAKLRGETPDLPLCLSDKAAVIEEIDFEIVEDAYDS